MCGKLCVTKTCVMWVLSCFIIYASAARSENTFATPDFAYPKTVEDNAGVEMQKALKAGDNISALRAALQLTIASDLISGDNAQGNIRMLDSLANVLPAPYSGLAYLCEARLYRDIYSANRWQYDNRTLPAANPPLNVFEWSRDLFANKVIGLTDRSFQNMGDSYDISLKNISGIVDRESIKDAPALSVADFMTIQAIYNLSTFSADRQETIPFFKMADKGSGLSGISTSSLSDRLLQENFRQNQSRGLTDVNAYIAYVCGQISGRMDDDYLQKCIDTYYDTPYCARFLYTAYRYKEQQAGNKDRYDRIKAYIALYPAATELKLLTALAEDYTRKHISFEVPNSQALPMSPISGVAKMYNEKDAYLLTVKLPDSYLNKNIASSDLKNVGKVVSVQKIEGSDSVPSIVEQEVQLAGVKAGVYAIVASKTETLAGLYANPQGNRFDTFLVSQLAMITTGGNSDDERIYIVDARNQASIAGAKVTFTPSYKQKGVSSVTLTTDKNGAVVPPKGSYNIKAAYNGNMFCGSTWRGENVKSRREQYRANILTDLSLYHPGDSIALTAVTYSVAGQTMNALTDSNVSLQLKDANWQTVDSLKVVTDRYGRADGKLKIPTSGLLGNYHLEAYKGETCIGQTWITVAEYKAPTFMVNAELLDKVSDNISADEIVIEGDVKTYSGMPMGNADIAYEVKYMPYIWRTDIGNATYGGKTKSDEEGRYEIRLPLVALRNTKYAHGRYVVQITATSPAGETQSAPGVSFALGTHYSILPSIPAMINVDKPTDKFTVNVTDALGRQVANDVSYRIISDKDSIAVADGSFAAPDFRYDFATLPSGRYSITFSMDSVSESATTIVWRSNDRKPPVETPLWVTDSKILVNPGQKEVTLKIGSSYADSYILVECADLDKVISREWVKCNGNIIPITLPAPAHDQRFRVYLGGMHNLTSKQESVEIIPMEQTLRLQIKSETFRDRIAPGASEHWKFQFLLDSKPMSDIAVAAVMTDKSLNAIQPFCWQFNPYGSLSWNTAGSMSYPYSNSYSWYITPDKTASRVALSGSVPDWQLYGYSLYGGMTYNARRIMKSYKNTMVVNTGNVVNELKEEAVAATYMAAAPDFTQMAERDDALDTDGLSASGSVDSANTKEQENLRPAEMPLAFFMPGLVTDSDGMVTIGFGAPNFVGTWQFQLMGYTSDMRGDVFCADVVSSKPVMASLSVPRFIRTGDTLYINATLYNNSDKESALSGRLVIKNPLTEEFYDSFEFAALQVPAMGSRQVKAKWTVPADLGFVSIQAYAISPDHTDGEQAIVPIYPITTPVIESQTFYLGTGVQKYEVKVPKTTSDVQTTLVYTNNPVWDCLLALPALSQTKSTDAPGIASSYFGMAVASGLVTKYPTLREALMVFADPQNSRDSTLVSKLEKNSELKTVALNNTPWLRNAQSSTLRMAGLIKYTDQDESTKLLSDALASLLKLQNKDGGFSWCPGMESSVWPTERIIFRLAQLQQLGFLGGEAKTVALKAVTYCDRQIVKDWKKVGEKNYNYLVIADYIYHRAMLTSSSGNADFAKIRKNTVLWLKANWKNLGIYDKAVAAQVLNTEGYGMEARNILESLRQYASYSPQKGMWFDNLKSLGGGSKILTTAKVLEAFKSISDDTESIDRMRQWLVMTTQTEDWGSMGGLPEAVAAVLTSRSNWTREADNSVSIKIDGVEVPVSRLSRLTGSLTLSLNNAAKIEIDKSGAAPAWGGIISQYTQQIAKVKSSKTSEISIDKKIYVISADSTGRVVSNGELKVGDRVRVSLTITSDRDLQYVAVTDERPACFEPENQLSGYMAADGIFMYREVRNTNTTAFISYLPKGTHVITYDCFVDRQGCYASGVATAQSQYAPAISAHSSGMMLQVK